jgi:hypothetical protein
MTVAKMIKKYSQMLKDGFEFVSIHEVVNDLNQCQRIRHDGKTYMTEAESMKFWAQSPEPTLYLPKRKKK